MRTLARTALIVATLAAGAAHAQKADAAAAQAEHIVGEVAVVKEGEVVFIVGDVLDLARMQELYLAVAKRGGLPFLEVTDAKLARKWFDVVPPKFDKNAAALADKMVALPDVRIEVERRDDIMKDVAVDRRTAYGESFSGLMDKAIKRGTRHVFVGNGLFPTKEAAKAAGVSEGDLKKVFEAGLAADGKAMNAAGETVRTAMQGKDVLIESKAGTSLKLKVGAKPMAISDGLITAAEAKAGGTSLLTWLPAGEVYGLVAPGSAEGKVVVPSFAVDGGEIVKDVTFTIAGGKLTAVAAAKPSKAFDLWKSRYDAAGAGKDVVSIVDVGLNPAAKQKGKPVLNYVPAGTVTVFIGGDTWAGGTNKLTYANTLFLTDATLKVGDAVVVDKGELKVPAAPAAAAAPAAPAPAAPAPAPAKK